MDFENNTRNPIFQMRSLNCEIKLNYCAAESNDTSNEKWFKLLFDEKLTFKDQWNKLETLFKN